MPKPELPQGRFEGLVFSMELVGILAIIFGGLFGWLAIYAPMTRGAFEDCYTGNKSSPNLHAAQLYNDAQSVFGSSRFSTWKMALSSNVCVSAACLLILGRGIAIHAEKKNTPIIRVVLSSLAVAALFLSTMFAFQNLFVASPAGEYLWVGAECDVGDGVPSSPGDIDVHFARSGMTMKTAMAVHIGLLLGAYGCILFAAINDAVRVGASGAAKIKIDDPGEELGRVSHSIFDGMMSHHPSLSSADERGRYSMLLTGGN